jgi:hypothetical protein
MEQNKIGFFSKSDNESFDWLNDYFNRKGIFFIEKRETQEWLTEDNQLTKDPLKAKQFEIYSQAMTYMVENHLNEPNGWTITEHEFINKKD